MHPDIDLLQTIWTHSPHGFLVVDRELRVRAANPALREALAPGLRPAGLPAEALPAELLDRLREALGAGAAAPAGDAPAGGDPAWAVDVHPLADTGLALALVRDVSAEAGARRDLAESQAFLDTLVRHAPVGFGLLDRELRYRLVNERLAEMNGLPAEAHLGRTPQELLPDLPESVYAGVLARALAGEPTAQMPISGSTPAQPGVERHWIESIYPVRDGRGEVIGVGIFVLEITERARAERRVRLLAEVSRSLDSAFGLEERLRALGGVLVPDLADGCVIDVLEGDGLRRAVVEHVDAEVARRLAALPRPLPESPSGRVAAGAPPILIEEVGERELRDSSHDEEDLERRRGLRTLSSILVPLTARGHVLGTLILSTTPASGRRYGEEDLRLATEIAGRAALAIENARLYELQRRVALELQRNLLPTRLATAPGLEAAARYEVAGEDTEVGGDFFDVFTTRDGRTWAVIGDVCGRGPEAAAVTALARHTIRAIAPGAADPREVVERLNEEMLAQRGDGRFACVTVVELAASAGDGPARARVLNAGQELPLVRRRDGALVTAGRPGSIVGFFPDLDVREVHVDLDPGDALVMFTDGLRDAMGDDGRLGDDPVLAALAGSAGDDADALARRLIALAQPAPGGRSGDDAAVVVVRVTG